MRRFLYWVLIALTWYLAGMYRSFPLLVLSIVELGLYVGSLVLCRVLRKGLSVGFVRERDSCEMDIPLTVEIRAENSSRLPVTRFSALLDIRHEEQRRRDTCTLWGSATRGAHVEALQLEVPWAGLVRLTLEEVRVYDWLSLSSARRSMDCRLELWVFPPDVPLRLVWPAGAWSAAQSAGTQVRNDPGSAYEEIRQVREYRPGDPARHVHWNLSAKTESLWIREYEQQTDETVAVRADLGSGEGSGAPSISCFYQVLYALLLGILERAAAVRVSWGDPRFPEPAERAAQDAHGCRQILGAIYETEGPDEPEAHATEDGFYLNRELELYHDGRLMHRFDPDGLDKEIQDGVFET